MAISPKATDFCSLGVVRVWRHITTGEEHLRHLHYHAFASEETDFEKIEKQRKSPQVHKSSERSFFAIDLGCYGICSHWNLKGLGDLFFRRPSDLQS